MGAQKKERTGKIISNRPLDRNENFWAMKIAAPESGFLPGQFFMIAVPEHSLRRAFAPSEFDGDGFAFIYGVVGEGTQTLSRLTADTPVSVIAPLGNGYDLSALTPDAAVILIGGGTGAPSLMPLAAALRRRQIKTHSLLGARDATRLLAAEELRAASDELTVVTDDGSAGERGNVLTALNRIAAAAAIFACGPRPMLQAVSVWAAAKKIPCQVSLEERMACGFGACMGCAVAVNVNGEKKYRRVCADGPVFNGAEIAWE
ncbi:dihydroorotate dehydrogenase B (NAD(+)), electron transfer subunit [Planctomycetales bacterium]|nr:dihydroorotate dehydrogenase B (NAD(+)), electron transfer subunit [Planctomycetales bacterium]